MASKRHREGMEIRSGLHAWVIYGDGKIGCEGWLYQVQVLIFEFLGVLNNFF
jgi:hypothetical protein